MCSNADRFNIYKKGFKAMFSLRNECSISKGEKRIKEKKRLLLQSTANMANLIWKREKDVNMTALLLRFVPFRESKNQF